MPPLDPMGGATLRDFDGQALSVWRWYGVVSMVSGDSERVCGCGDLPNNEGYKKILKKKAPVQLTGGAGFRYENSVAARFLLDLLSGTNALGVDFGRIIRIDWQARDTGWLADDLVITCQTSGGDRTAALSIKTSQQVTRAGFPHDFVEIAWAQWLGIKTDRKLRDSNDAIVLVTASLAHDMKDAWLNFLYDALPTAPERMAARLSQSAAADGSQSSALQRALLRVSLTRRSFEKRATTAMPRLSSSCATSGCFTSITRRPHRGIIRWRSPTVSVF